MAKINIIKAQKVFTVPIKEIKNDIDLLKQEINLLKQKIGGGKPSA